MDSYQRLVSWIGIISYHGSVLRVRIMDSYQGSDSGVTFQTRLKSQISKNRIMGSYHGCSMVLLGCFAGIIYLFTCFYMYIYFNSYIYIYI